jgi:hypothetical protein
MKGVAPCHDHRHRHRVRKDEGGALVLERRQRGMPSIAHEHVLVLDVLAEWVLGHREIECRHHAAIFVEGQRHLEAVIAFDQPRIQEL